MTFEDLISKRRSIYHLSATLPISETAVAELVKNAVLQSPTAFNSQSGRVVLLFGDDNQKLWQLTADALQKVTTAEQFVKTRAKIDSFAAGAGSVLFFIDDAVTQDLQQKFPSYAANFPVWAEQAEGMLQYIVWSLLAEHNIGASLQHYNPLIDEAVRRTFDIPPTWRLTAQMPFGGIAQKADAKTYLPIEQRLKIFGLR